jgi:capsular polysaccharide biosynthesis protein
MRKIKCHFFHFPKKTSNDEVLLSKSEYPGGAGISFSDLLLFIKRNWIILISSIALGITFSGIFVTYAVKDKFTSSGALGFSDIVHDSLYATIQETLVSETSVTKYSDDLAKNGIVHFNGAKIESAEIRSGITMSVDTSSLRLTVYFTSTDSSIVVNVANEIIDSTYSHFKDGGNYSGIEKYLVIDEKAAVFTKNSNLRPFYALTGVLAFALIGLASSYIYEKAKGNIYGFYSLSKTDLPVYLVNESSHDQL